MTKGNVVPLHRPHVQLLATPAPAAPLPRETSWRDLVRRLAKNLAKR